MLYEGRSSSSVSFRANRDIDRYDLPEGSHHAIQVGGRHREALGADEDGWPKRDCAV